jgi:hypothetical protein
VLLPQPALRALQFSMIPLSQSPALCFLATLALSKVSLTVLGPQIVLVSYLNFLQS